MQKPHKILDLWEAAMKAAQIVYRLTNSFPVNERFGLVSYMRRAAASIPRNIEKATARKGNGEFRNSLALAQDSLSELDTQLDLALRLGYIEKGEVEELLELLTRVANMFAPLICSPSEKEIDSFIDDLAASDLQHASEF